MSSLEIKKQRLCQTFNIRLSEINNKISKLQSVIQDDTIPESILLDYLLKSDLNIQTAINMHFKSPSPSLSPTHNNKNTQNSNNSIPPSVKYNINAISDINNNKKRKRNFNTNSNNNNETPVHKRRKMQTNNTEKKPNINDNTNSMKEERDSDDDMDMDMDIDINYNINWNEQSFGIIKMDYSVLRRYHKSASIHHIPQGVLNGDIKINKYYKINANMTNKAKINIYYKNALNELKFYSTKNNSNIKITLKKKLLICGKSELEISNEYKENEKEFTKLRMKQRLKESEERQRLLPIYKKRKIASYICLFEGKSTNEIMESIEFETILLKQIENEISKKRKRIKMKPVVINSKYMIEFEVKFFRQNICRNNIENISFEKINIPYTMGLLSNTKELLNNINTILCVRNHFKRRHLSWISLTGLLDFACRYEYKINECNNDSSYKHGLNVKLYEYQLQSLDWMIKEENDTIGFHRYLYSKGKFRNGLPFWYSTVFQHLIVDNGNGKDFIPITHGGFLCEEMGLGKTIITLALINCNKPNDLSDYSTYSQLKIGCKNEKNKIFYKSRATLIIAPVTLVGQWEKEIDSKNINNIKYKTYYGGGRSRDIRDYICNDIVLTTYHIIALESGNDINRHMLHNIEWHRIILDESHYIKNSNTNTAKYINTLKGINKWCVTGTPFNTSIKDIICQLKFIGIRKNHINRLNLDNIAKKKLFNGHGSLNSAQSCIPLMYIMKMLVMRHKKDQLFNNKSIITLKPKTEDVIYIEFTNVQREYYNKLYEIALQKYNEYKLTNNIGRGTLAITASLYQSRQACSGHIFNKTEINQQLNIAQKKTHSIKTMVNSNKNKNKSKKELFQMANDKAYNMNDECPICYECPLDFPLQTPCNHVYCGECIKSILIQQNQCPICRKECKINQLKQPFKTKEEQKIETKKPLNNNNINNENKMDEFIKFDSKLNRLIFEIKRIKKERPNDKSLIFTSFSNSLNWICSELQKNGIQYRTLMGNMSMKKRKKQMEEFSNNKNVSVFVLTVRTGAVGITLNSANHVFMLEPTMNFALYQQAINRVYRLGQKKKVFIYTLIMKNSIEEKIWNINKQKYNQINNNNNNNNVVGNINKDQNIKLQKHEISKLFESFN